jgi:NADH dehydrogenase
MDPHAAPRHQVVVVGGGFGGLNAVRGLAHAHVGVTLVDRRNFHLFQPLLYQVASGWLSPAEIAAPLRPLLRRQGNTEVLLGEVVDVDLEARRVLLADGSSLAYDSLVVSAGSRVDYPEGMDWNRRAPGLKSVEDAIDIRRRVLLAFEAAERERRRDGGHRADARRAWLTFVVIGGGTTGVELAGVLAELSREILRGDFRHVDPTRAEIVLVQSRDRILPDFEPALSASATRDLHRLRVRIVTNARVARIDDDGVTLRHKANGAEERIMARTVLWAAGVRPERLGERLCAAAGVEPVDRGLVPVGPDLTIAGHPDVFVIGDLAAHDQDGAPLPGVAPVAMQGGAYVARTIAARLAGRPQPPFRYRDKGLLATIGRGAAVAQLGRVRFDGFVAWVVWVFVHLLYLVEFQSRLVVLLRWAWDFFLHQRGARLITGPGATRTAAAAPAPQAAAAQLVEPEEPAKPVPVGAGHTGAPGRPDGRAAARRERLRVGSVGRRR